MRPLWSKTLRFRKLFRQLTAAALGLVLGGTGLRPGCLPLGERGRRPAQAFTSTIARGLSLVAIVVSGLTFAFGEGGSNECSQVFSSGLAWPSPPSTSWPGFFREASGRQDHLIGARHG